ncbi:hypothetical protein CRENBAI_005883 [Crenichthys baileyi]|uniref:Uncharacterized protein n=1 Tax=Crenichthys baileyi TaxID=28760 RepID=A0AAV9RN09_9TELE
MNRAAEIFKSDLQTAFWEALQKPPDQNNQVQEELYPYCNLLAQLGISGMGIAILASGTREYWDSGAKTVLSLDGLGIWVLLRGSSGSGMEMSWCGGGAVAAAIETGLGRGPL